MSVGQTSNRVGPVLVAMSGGVDSSVVAGLLRERGYDVVGVTMQIWQESQTDPRHAGCCSLGAVEDARRVARILDIPHYVLNFQEEFRRGVIDTFVEEYAAGRTPNPCIECNKTVKFEILMSKMRELGCTRLATGHYARIRHRGDRYHLLRARGEGKDQSYVLYMLDQEQLASSWFPLGEVADKASTRAIARRLELPVADKPDSQEICFVSEAGGYQEFLRRKRPDLFSAGEIVDTSGRVIGSHEGTVDFTIGQRRGVGVSARTPLYVIDLDPVRNRVVVGADADLLREEVSLRDVVWGAAAPDCDGLRVTAKIRSNMSPQPARLYGGASPRLMFDDPVRAVTPGQIAVAYRGKSVAAGGVIISR